MPVKDLEREMLQRLRDKNDKALETAYRENQGVDPQQVHIQNQILLALVEQLRVLNQHLVDGVSTVGDQT